MDTKKQSSGKPRGKTNSLVWRLTVSQLWRSFFQLLWLDALLAALFICAMTGYSEWAAADLSSRLLENPSKEIALVGAAYSINTEPPHGWRLPDSIGRQTSSLRGSARSIESADNTGMLRRLNSIRYTVSIPDLDSGNVVHITIYWDKPAQIFYSCMLVVILWQGVGWLRSIFRVSRSVRQTLRPIYELTKTAHTIKNADPARQRVEDLHLSGTIETLNTITENRLDTRIVIADEREELRGLANAINEMLDRLDAAYQSQLRFVSDASHELRTPIAVIQGYANLLDRWGKDDEKTLLEAIGAIKSEAHGMQDLVEQLLFLARSDNDSIVLNTVIINITELAEEVLSETNMIDPHHMYDRAFDTDLYVYGDIQLIKQALRIFVDNAIKYTPAGEKIKISVTRDDDFVKLSVSDNGIGIPEKDLPYVFDRFFRSEQSRARKTGGTGLGLSIAKWIIDRHGGHVELLSRQGIGTRISFVLPLPKQAQPPEAD